MNGNLIDISALESLPTSILVVDNQGTVSFINEKFKSTYTYDLDDIPSIADWWKKDCFVIDDGSDDLSWSHILNKLDNSSDKQIAIDFTLACWKNTRKNIKITFKRLQDNILLTVQDTTLVKQSSVSLKNKTINDVIENALPGIFYVYNEEGNLINYNHRHATAFGYLPEEIKNRHITTWFAPEDRDFILDTVQKLHKEEITNAEVNILNKDGIPTPYLCTGHSFEHDGEKLFCGVGIDISERKKAIAAREESEIKYETLINSFPDIILVSDLQGKLLYANPALKRQTGLSFEDFQGNNENKFIHPDNEPMVREKIKDLLQGSKRQTEIIENRFIDKYGNLHWYSGVISKTMFKGELALQIISRDITKSKEAEIALIESEERMSSIFDNAPVAMLLLNQEREILQINKKGLENIRKSKDETISLRFGEVYKCITSFNNLSGCGSGDKCSQCLIKSTVEDTFKTGKPHFKVEITLDTVEGPQILHLSTDLLNLNNRKEILASIDDITERKSIEIQLKQAKEHAEESDRLKTAFLQNMSHEIRTPLNGILGFSGLLNNKDISDEEKGYYLNVINESSNQLLSIVDNILSLSRLETENIEVANQEVNINEVLGSLFFEFNTKAKDKNLLLHPHKPLDNRESAIFTDSAKIQLILQNLLSNAIKFTHEGHVKYGYSLKDGFIEFFVEDTGIGIEKIYFNKIFERFQQIDDDMTRKYGGTGLGLTIAKGNVELLGGKLWLTSEPNKGSTFYFTIPYKPVYEIIKEDTKDEVTRYEEAVPVILVAEDEEINYLFIEEALKGEDVKLIHAMDGREAVKICQENQEISLVLMDIKMPHMDGYQALEKITEARPNLPIVAQTAYAFFSDKQKALESGFTDYISKPIKKEQLIGIVNKHTSKTA